MKKIFKAKFTKDGVKIPFYKRKWFIILAVLFIFTAIFYEEDKPDQAANEDIAPLVEQTNNKDVLEIAEVEEEEEEEEEKDKSNLLADLDPQEMLDKTKFKVNMMTSVDFFIEEYEKQRIRKNKFDTTVYSSDIIKDQSGVEFPYSFMVTGRYEEKGTGALRDFTMTLVFKDDEGLEDGSAYCMQYMNDDTGTYFNVMDPEDDAMLKLLELLEDN